MGVTERARLLVPRRVREVPADLAAVVCYLLVTDGFVLLPVLRETPVRVALGIPLVLFVPGYVFVAALFPEGGSDDDLIGEASDGIDGIERVALSFGTSVVIVPLLGLLLNFTPWGIRLEPIVLCLTVFVLGATAVSVRRRRALPVDERFAVPYRQWAAAARTELFEPDTRVDAALNVAVVLTVLLAAVSVGYAVTVPKQGEAYTEFYLLTETDDGELTASGYPTELTVGESRPLVVGVGNHEHEPTNYTVVAELHRVRTVDNTTDVTETVELDRFETGTVQPNASWQRSHAVTPTLTGTRLRLTYLLYRGPPPSNPTVENAYRENHLWVNVTAG